jgi:hypothetical protein
LTPKVSDRVLAEWPEEVDWWYPGIISAADGVRLQIQFDDGDRATLLASQVRPLIVGEGSRVFGRFKGGAYYYPGAATARNGEAIHIAYDDGDEEWTTISMIRIHRQDLPAPV